MTTDIKEALDLARNVLKIYPSAYKTIVAHIAKLEAVVEAAKKLDREMKKGNGKIIANTIPALEAAQELVNAIAALDGTNVPSQ